MATACGLERYAAYLPPVDEFITLGEGGTPVLKLDNLARRLGLRWLSAKMETCNPTGSYKDRIAAMSLSLARQRADIGWIATSSGNAGVAMAAYGARAGLPGFLCLVGSAPQGKRLSLMPYGVDVAAVDGVGQHSTAKTDGQLFDQVRAAAARYNLYLGITAHAYNPFGMLGADTIGYELADQVPAATHVYVPVGGGGLISAVGRGLSRRAMPAALIACQPSGCDPIVRFLDGTLTAPEIAQCTSQISALQLPHPPDGIMAADAVRQSSGWGTAVDDPAIYAAQCLLSESEGLFVEPASATGFAALLADVECGRLDVRDHPVLILTGAGWKDLEQFGPQAEKIVHIRSDEVATRVEFWADKLPARPVAG